MGSRISLDRLGYLTRNRQQRYRGLHFLWKRRPIGEAQLTANPCRSEIVRQFSGDVRKVITARQPVRNHREAPGEVRIRLVVALREENVRNARLLSNLILILYRLVLL